MIECQQFVLARNGHPVATAAVVDRLRPRLVSMALYYARRSQEDPDDLLQEAWLGVLEALPDLDVRIGSPEQYLIQHARWRLLDAIKYAHLRRCASLEPNALDEQTDEAEAHSAIEMMVAEACVEEFAGRLKTAQREVLGCLLRGLTWREAGSVLGCSSANIAYHVRQIRLHYERWSTESLPHSGGCAG